MQSLTKFCHNKHLTRHIRSTRLQHTDNCTNALNLFNSAIFYWQTLRPVSLLQPVGVERCPNSLLPGNARNMPTCLQHTLSFQLPWRPVATPRFTVWGEISTSAKGARIEVP